MILSFAALIDRIHTPGNQFRRVIDSQSLCRHERWRQRPVSDLRFSRVLVHCFQATICEFSLAPSLKVAAVLLRDGHSESEAL
jgi:hypothetical protein